MHDYPITSKEIVSSGQLPGILLSIPSTQAQLGLLPLALYPCLVRSIVTLQSPFVWPSSNGFSTYKNFYRIICKAYGYEAFWLKSHRLFRSANDSDRRYLLYNPIQKMKVTTQGMKVIDMLLDAINATGYEQDTYFELAVRDIGMIPSGRNYP